MKKQVYCLLLLLSFLLACSHRNSRYESPIEATMNDITTRIRSNISDDELNTLDQGYILDFLTKKEKDELSVAYWRFQVNVPAIVSVMRDKNQPVVPFWLEATGFVKTEKTVSNLQTDYEVWQKAFPKGEVGLGINGFDRHRLLYFVSVAPQDQQDRLEISPIFPKNQQLDLLIIGSYTYTDWDELVLISVPKSMRGQILLSTFRGRAREATLIDAFRKTEFPSSSRPDQLLLTWDSDPSTSIVVQWRNAGSIDKSTVVYWEVGHQDTLTQDGERQVLGDRLITNERYVSRFKARLSALKPATTYHYYVKSEGVLSEVHSFETAGSDDEFSFIWFGETLNDRKWGKVLQLSHQKFPNVSFYSISGDLVDNGLNRDDWDRFFGYSGSVFSEKPLLAVPGNHDSQDGLGAALFQDLLTFPANGPFKESTGLTYAITYENALFVYVDMLSFSVKEQSKWIEQQLKKSDAPWKFVTFHFSPYNTEEDYPEMIHYWIPIFDKYQVDMVMSGHHNYYMRSFPLFNNQRVEGASYGTRYIMSTASEHWMTLEGIPEPYAEVKFKEGYLFQRIHIKGNTLAFQAFDSTGVMFDEFKIIK